MFALSVLVVLFGLLFLAFVVSAQFRRSKMEMATIRKELLSLAEDLAGVRRGLEKVDGMELKGRLSVVESICEELCQKINGVLPLSSQLGEYNVRLKDFWSELRAIKQSLHGITGALRQFNGVRVSDPEDNEYVEQMKEIIAQEKLVAKKMLLQLVRAAHPGVNATKYESALSAISAFNTREICDCTVLDDKDDVFCDDSIRPKCAVEDPEFSDEFRRNVVALMLDKAKDSDVKIERDSIIRFVLSAYGGVFKEAFMRKVLWDEIKTRVGHCTGSSSGIVFDRDTILEMESMGAAGRNQEGVYDDFQPHMTVEDFL